MRLLAGLVIASGLLAPSPADDPLLVEAEGFEDCGGWALDPQFMHLMGSPFLLAHGMGEPVKDAVTTVEIPRAGAWRVWVRTRDWTAPWKAPEPPGRFQVLLDGKPLAATFGTAGAAWHWQEGGTADLPAGKVRLALHDLTGFDGRADAVLLSRDSAFKPPETPEALAAFRRKALAIPEAPPDAGRYDLVVAGGGMAGCCAAVAAARLGLKVALIQDRPVLGGNNSSEVRVSLGGGIQLPPYPAIGGVVRELDGGAHGNAGPAEKYDDARKLRVVRAEENISLFLNTRVEKVEKEGDRIAAVVGRDTRTNRELRFPARWFADCTGDAWVGVLAGAEFRTGREARSETGESLAPEAADRMVMGTSLMWYTAPALDPSPFPDCPWALQFTEESAQKAVRGDWDWETGMERDPIADFEAIRDHALRAIYGNWAFLKNRSRDRAKYEDLKLAWVAHIGGKRESRRLMGDVVLRQQDIDDGTDFPDACVTTTWTIDLHYPQAANAKHFPDGPFRSIAQHRKIKPYPVPYRCFYSRNVPNLFMAGRCVSVTHVALGTVRVMRTCGMMGEVVGMAASLCRKHGTDPRGVYKDHLPELKDLWTRGVGKLPAPPAAGPSGLSPDGLKPPPWLAAAGANLARSAKVTVSGSHESGKYRPEHLTDGKVTYTDNNLRWVSDANLPATVELAWEAPRAIGAVRIVTGWNKGGAVVDMISDFALHYSDGGAWKPVPGGSAVNNTRAEWGVTFDPVQASRLRLTVTAAPGNLARIWEIEVYGKKP